MDRNMEISVETMGEEILLRMAVRPADDDSDLHKTGRHRRHSSSLSSQLRAAEFTEDQKIIQHEVYQDRDNARLHRKHGLSGLS